MLDDAFQSYRHALAALARAGIAARDIAGLAAFTTGAPTADLAAALTDALARPLPAAQPFKLMEVFDDYCVFASTIAMPDYQSGTPPYTQSGGSWKLGADGRPIYPRDEGANLV